MIRKKLCIIIISLVMTISLYGQTNARLWGGLEVGFGLSLADKGNMYDLTYSDTNMKTSTIRAVIGYYVVPQLSLGIGVGLSSYTKPNINTVPLCLDIRFHPLQDNRKFVLNSNIGYSLATSESDLNSKFMTDFAVGYELFKINKLSVVPAVGYNFNTYSIDNVFGKSNQSRHSVFMKIGLIY